MRKNLNFFCLHSKKFSLIFLFLILLVLSSCVFQTGVLDVSKDYILFLNSTGNVILPYDIVGEEFIDAIPVGEQANANYAPQQIIGSDNYIYVVNSLDNSISKFTLNLGFIKKYLLPPGTNPYNAFIDGGYMYISGNVSGRVLKLDLETDKITSSDQLYQENCGLQTIANFGTDYLLTINTNYNLNTNLYEDSKLYILKKDNMQKVAELDLSQAFIGLDLVNFTQAVIHDDNQIIDLLATGNYYSQSGFLRLKVIQSGSSFSFEKISSSKLPDGEYIGGVSTTYGGSLYFVTNSNLYKTLMNESVVTFSSGIEKNSNINVGEHQVSVVKIGELSDGEVYITILNTPWNKPNQFSLVKLTDFKSLNFSNFVEFSGYPVDLYYRKGK